MTKNILITLNDLEFQNLKSKKGKLSWKDYLMKEKDIGINEDSLKNLISKVIALLSDEQLIALKKELEAKV